MRPPTIGQRRQLRRALGDEIRTARKKRGWTRKDLHDAMCLNDEDELSLQTLATYELGTRRISVERLVQICAALDEDPDELLARAFARTFKADQDSHVHIDLVALARSTDPRLQRLQQWAAVRSRQSLAPVEELDHHAVAALARVAETTPHQLVHALRSLTRATSA
jgi:transcriptional regulator with XRE-family HTH domain